MVRERRWKEEKDGVETLKKGLDAGVSLNTRRLAIILTGVRLQSGIEDDILLEDSGSGIKRGTNEQHTTKG